jgi:hypothetical protein
MLQVLGDQAVLLDLRSEHFYGLNSVGARIWELLEHETPLAEVFEKLCAEFDADPRRIESDLLALADQLHRAGLLRLVSAPDGHA